MKMKIIIVAISLTIYLPFFIQPLQTQAQNCNHITKIVINTNTKKLYTYKCETELNSFSVAVGGSGKETENNGIITRNNLSDCTFNAGNICPGWGNNFVTNYEMCFSKQNKGPLAGQRLCLHGTGVTDSIGQAVSNGCVRMRPSDITSIWNDFQNNLNDNPNATISVQITKSQSGQVGSTAPKNNTNSVVQPATQTQQPERSNLSTNGIIRKPRIPPTTTTPRTTIPSGGSTPSNSGSDKPKQSCSAIQSEIKRISDNKKDYSNADQQISTRQAKIDNNQCT